MKVIHKIQLKDIPGPQDVMLPFGANVISTHEQSGIVCVWFVCNPENKPEKRTLHIYLTGIELPEYIASLKFIGTILNIDGFVLHVFEGDLP